jgi:hypothetical protein
LGLMRAFGKCEQEWAEVQEGTTRSKAHKTGRWTRDVTNNTLESFT